MTRMTRKRIEVSKHILASLVSSLILYEKVKTTEAKAREARSLIEKIITRAKKDSLASRRYIFGFIPQKEAAKKVVEALAKRYKSRPGGYTRITKLGQRKGDAAKIVEISLIEE